MDDLTYIELNETESISKLIENIFKFFVERKYISNETEINDSLRKELLENKSLELKLNDKKYSIQIILSNLKNIPNGSSLDDYLSKHLDTKKFIFVKDFNKKVYNLISDKYVNSQIFFFHEFMEFLPGKDFIPKHILLNANEKEELIKTYNLKQLSKIHDTDIMCRYYGGKKSDVFRILRPHINSGFSVHYRVVIPGDQDILFS